MNTIQYETGGPHVEPKPVICFGGVLTIKQLLPLYRGILGTDPSSDLDARQRFVPIPRQHLAPPAEMHERFQERFLKLYDRLETDQKAVVVGHSLGGLLAYMIGMEHPDKVSDVVCIAGAQEGIKKESPTTTALIKSIGKPAVTKHIRYDSDFMEGLRQDGRTRWSSEVGLHLHSPTVDDLILAPQGLGIELPRGQQARCNIVAPNWPGLRFAIRRIPGMPGDVGFLPSWRPTGHCDLPLAPSVIQYVQNLRSEGAQTLPNVVEVPIALAA